MAFREGALAEARVASGKTKVCVEEEEGSQDKVKEEGSSWAKMVRVEERWGQVQRVTKGRDDQLGAQVELGGARGTND